MNRIGSQAIQAAGRSAVALLALLALLVSINVIIHKKVRLRADLTEEKLYSLSEGTKRTLEAVADSGKTVTLKFFYNESSPDVPGQIRAYANEIKDLLRAYRLQSDGSLLIEEYDPQPFTDEEKAAQLHQIPNQPWDMFGAPISLGIVAMSGNEEQSIPVLSPAKRDQLEYDLTRLIYRVLYPTRPVVGVISSLPVMGGPNMPYPMPQQQPQQQPWMVFQTQEQDYEFRPLSGPIDAIDPEISALLVIHPKDLDEATQFAIDQYVLGGGQLVAFVDPSCFADQGGPQQQPFRMPQASSGMDALFAAWGIGFDATKVLADFGSATQMPGRDGRPTLNPTVISAARQNMRGESSLTSQIESMTLPWPGAFTDSTQGDLTCTPLLASSANAGLVNSFTAQADADVIRKELKPQGQLSLAVRLSGTFHTAFPDGNPAEAAGAEDEEDDEAATQTPDNTLKEGKSTVVLVADVDVLYDPVCYRAMRLPGGQTLPLQLNDNITFFANALEEMTKPEELRLVGLRTRGKIQRPFERVQKLEEEANNELAGEITKLNTRLQEISNNLREMEAREGDNRLVMSREQRKAQQQLVEEQEKINRTLWELNNQLLEDVESLGFRVKLLNMLLVPACIAMGGIVYGIRRRVRR